MQTTLNYAVLCTTISNKLPSLQCFDAVCWMKEYHAIQYNQ